jgi:hypothetical protein
MELIVDLLREGWHGEVWLCRMMGASATEQADVGPTDTTRWVHKPETWIRLRELVKGTASEIRRTEQLENRGVAERRLEQWAGLRCDRCRGSGHVGVNCPVWRWGGCTAVEGNNEVCGDYCHGVMEHQNRTWFNLGMMLRVVDVGRANEGYLFYVDNRRRYVERDTMVWIIGVCRAGGHGSTTVQKMVGVGAEALRVLVPKARVVNEVERGRIEEWGWGCRQRLQELTGVLDSDWGMAKGQLTWNPTVMADITREGDVNEGDVEQMRLDRRDQDLWADCDSSDGEMMPD